MGVKDRILQFIALQKLSVKQFEEKCDLSNGYISSMRKGFGALKLENVLFQFPELNRDWLLFGEGEMLKTGENLVKSPAADYEKAPTGSGLVEFLMEQNRSLEKIVHDQNKIMMDQNEIIKTHLQRITELEAEIHRSKNESNAHGEDAGCAAVS